MACRTYFSDAPSVGAPRWKTRLKYKPLRALLGREDTPSPMLSLQQLPYPRFSEAQRDSSIIAGDAFMYNEL